MTERTVKKSGIRRGILNPLRIAAIYALVGGAWILLSDMLVGARTGDPRAILIVQTSKGLVFVAVTSVVLYCLIRVYSIERARAEHAARAADDQRRLLLEQIPAVLWTTDAGLRFTSSAGTGLEVLNLRPKEVTGRSLFDYFQTGDPDYLPIAMHRRALAGEELSYDITWQDRTWETHLKPLRSEDGAVVGVAGAALDITDRARTAESLRLWEALFKHASWGIVAVEPAGNTLIAVNPAFAQMHGYAVEEMVGMHLHDFFSPEVRSELPHHIRTVHEMGYHQFESELVRKDGTRFPVFMNVIAFKDAKGSVLLRAANVLDITERKRVEEELRNLAVELERRVATRTAELQESRRTLMNLVEDLNRKTEELEQANSKLRDVDRLKSLFIASMSHELRTPLNSIIGFSSVLLNEWPGTVNDEQKDLLGTVLRSGKHLLALINDVIDVSKIEAGTVDLLVEDFDLHDVIAEAAAQFATEVGDKGLGFSAEAVRQPMHTDRRRLLQCVTNLISNAVKFTEKGSVRVQAREVQRSEFNVQSEKYKNSELRTMNSELDRDFIEITVIDTGIGIKADDLPRLFQPFARLDSPLRSRILGTGLGLYLTRKLAVEVLKGDVTVESEEGKGSRFSVRIPVSIR